MEQARPELKATVFPGNGFLVTRFRARRPEEGVAVIWTPLLPGYHLLDPNSHPLPIVSRPGHANLSVIARQWLRALDLPDLDLDEEIA